MSNRERVARAIFAADSTDSDWKFEPSRWDRAKHDERERYLRLAAAAIEAIENG